MRHGRELLLVEFGFNPALDGLDGLGADFGVDPAEDDGLGEVFVRHEVFVGAHQEGLAGEGGEEAGLGAVDAVVDDVDVAVGDLALQVHDAPGDGCHGLDVSGVG